MVAEPLRTKIVPGKTLYLWRGSARCSVLLVKNSKWSDMSISVGLRYRQAQNIFATVAQSVRKKIAVGQGSLMSQTCLQFNRLLPLRCGALDPSIPGLCVPQSLVIGCSRQGRVEMPWMVISMPCFRTLAASKRQGRAGPLAGGPMEVHRQRGGWS
jgi:hypothetical protein